MARDPRQGLQPRGSRSHRHLLQKRRGRLSHEPGGHQSNPAQDGYLSRPAYLCVTRRLAERLDAPAVLAGYSRLVIDCNRPPGDPTSIAQVSDGILIPGNLDLDDAAADARLNALFWPYHRAIAQMLAQRWRHGNGRAPALIAIHSFTPVMGGFRRPWQIGVLWNRDPRLASLLLDGFRADETLCVGDNEPYSGREVGFTMNAHGGAAGLAHVEIELRQDLIADASGCERWARVVGDALAEALRNEALYRVRHY